MSQPNETVLCDIDSGINSGIATLTLNRPERNNGWTNSLEEAYFGALIDAAANPEVKVIVVTGAGRSFCPGLDMAVLSASATAGTPSTMNRRYPMTMARFIPKPVIALVSTYPPLIWFSLQYTTSSLFERVELPRSTLPPTRTIGTN